MSGTVHKTIKIKGGHRVIRVETRRPCRDKPVPVIITLAPVHIPPAIPELESDVGKLAESVARELCNRSNFPRHWYDGAIG